MKSRINIEDKKKVRILWGLALVISSALILGTFIFGSRLFMFNDVGSDTINQYYPYYVSVVTRISEGTFGIWNSQHGLGTSLINNISQTLDPFGWIVILAGVIGGIDVIKYMLVFMQIIKIFCAAYLCRIYLKIFNVSETAACIASYLYAFNGYLMLWGQHYMMGTGSIYIILVLIFVEKMIRESGLKWRVGLALSVAISVFYSYYISYMILLFCGFYFCVRIFYPVSCMGWKVRLCKAIHALLAVVTGMMMAGTVLLPSAAYLLLSSSRLESDVSLIQKFINYLTLFFPLNHIGQATSRMMSNNLLYINSEILPGWGNYYEMPNLFYTTFIFIIFSQFLTWMFQIRRKEPRKTVYFFVCIMVMAFLLLNQGISVAFNAFTYPQSRSMFVVLPVFALMMSFVWDECIERKRISIGGVAAGTFFSVLVLLYSYRRAASNVKVYNIFYGILILLFAVVMLCIRIQNKKSKYVKGMLIVLLMITTIFDSMVTNNQRIGVYKYEFTQERGFDERVNSTKEALAYLKGIDDSVYRVEKDYVDVTLMGDPLIEGYSSVTDYNSTVNRNVLSFYENLYSNVLQGFAWKIFNLNNPTDIIPMQLVNLKYLLTKELIDYEGFEYLNIVGDVYIYKNIYANSIVHWYTRTISQDKCIDMSEEDKKNIVLNTAIVEAENDIFSEGVESGAHIGEFVETGSGRIEGSIENSEQGILMLAIPDQQGWEIYVDGIQQEIINVDYGFIGVELRPGEHIINAVYRIPYLREGIILSFAGITLLLIQIILERRRYLSEKN